MARIFTAAKGTERSEGARVLAGRMRPERTLLRAWKTGENAAPWIELDLPGWDWI